MELIIRSRNNLDIWKYFNFTGNKKTLSFIRAHWYAINALLFVNFLSVVGALLILIESKGQKNLSQVFLQLKWRPFKEQAFDTEN